MRRILAVVGSRSAAIRIAPLVRLLRRVPSMQAVVCIASPHAQQVAGELAVFGIQADEEVDKIACQANEDIGLEIERLIRKHKPDCVLVQGDAGVVMGAFRRQAAYGNLGNGLRLYELYHHAGDEPHTVDLIATHYFVSSEAARDNLRKEGVGIENIYVTDSTAVDALLMVIERIRSDSALQAGLAAEFPAIGPDRRLVYVPCQHGDSSVEHFENICRTLKRLAMRPDVQVVCRAHPEQEMRRIAEHVFADHPRITVVGQQDYLRHVYLMQEAYFILSDADHACDEVLSLGKPVLVMRDAADAMRSEDGGTVKRVGADAEHILRECNMFLDDEAYYQAFSSHRNYSGDGQASQRIVETMLR
jgi:UDP-N-acetylglucosamine 2-epimerase (non-hydrolysing)